MDGVAEELVESGFAKESVEKYMDLFKAMGSGVEWCGSTVRKNWVRLFRAKGSR